MLGLLSLTALWALSLAGREHWAAWSWLGVLLPVECHQAFYLWSIYRLHRDGKDYQRYALTLVYSLYLEPPVAAGLFVFFVPSLVEASTNYHGLHLMAALVVVWWPYYLWRNHSVLFAPQPWIGLWYWTHHSWVKLVVDGLRHLLRTA